MKIISLVDQLLNDARRLRSMGLHVRARQRLERAIRLDVDQHDTRRDAHALLAEIHIDAQRYRLARRHLRIALSLDPHHPELLFRMATALELDANIDPRLAFRPMLRAVHGNPTEPRYWCGLAQVYMRLGRDRHAAKAFRKAVQLDPNNLDILTDALDGLRSLGRWKLARRLLQEARFRLSYVPQIEQLWERFCYQMIVRQQQRNQVALTFPVNEGPCILPFVPRFAEADPVGEPVILRHDRFSQSRPHAPNISLHRPDPRRGG